MNDFVWETVLDNEDTGGSKSNAKGCWDYAKETAETRIKNSITQWNEKDGAKDHLTYHGECWFPKKINKEQTAVEKYSIKLKIGVVNMVLGKNRQGNDTKSITVKPDEVSKTLDMMLRVISGLTSKDDSPLATAMWKAAYDSKKPKQTELGEQRKSDDKTLAFENDMFVWK